MPLTWNTADVESSPMSYRRLGKSGLFVHPVALGTMQFGWTADEPTAFAIMDAFVEVGAI